MRPFSTPLGRWLGVTALAVALASPALAQRNVTLRMNSATMPDTVKASAAAGVQVRGNIGADGADMLPGGNTIAWDNTTTLKPTNVGGDYWEIDFQIPDNEKLDFKFYIDQSEGANLPGGWEDGSNHSIAAGTGSVTLDLHYFEKDKNLDGNSNYEDQAYDWRPFAAGGDSIAVWFRVYMDTENAVNVKKYTADDENLVVAVRGNLGTRGGVGAGGAIVDWGGTAATLTRESDNEDAPGYHLFSGLVRFPATQADSVVSYKFYLNDSDVSGDNGYEEGGNRTFTIPAAGTDTTLHWVLFSNSPARKPDAAEPVTATTTFVVDVTPLNDIGVFSTSDDEIQLRGGPSPTGWNDCSGGDNPTDDCVLGRTPGTLTYSTSTTLTAAPGTDYIYKYYAKFDPALPNPDFGYEEPLDYGGGNRPYTFSGTDETIGPQFFNGIRPGNVIADGQNVVVSFNVDMSRALTIEPASDAFDPATDVVTVSFRDPIWRLTQTNTTFSSEGITDAVRLTDPDGDMVYTGTYTVQGPTYNGIGYRYAFGDPSGGTSAYFIEGSGGFDAGRRRYRYVTDVTADQFAFALDTFRQGGDGNPLPWEVNPEGTIQPGDVPFSVRNGYVDAGQAVANETDGPVASALSLGNVYPNPATGTARVVVSSRADARVTVRVYDVTGRVVGTVVEGALVSERPLEIDTRGLAAGLYLVRADSESGVATARLTVVR